MMLYWEDLFDKALSMLIAKYAHFNTGDNTYLQSRIRIKYVQLP